MIKECMNCHQLFNADWNKRKFCSRHCSHSYNGRQRYVPDSSIYEQGLSIINSYIMGLICTDGCVSKEVTGKERITLSLQLQDVYMIAQIHDLWTPKKSIYYYKNSASLISHNQFDIDFLKQYGICERKSKVLQLPVLPDEFMSHFIRGVFDGDGCVYCNNTHNNGRIYHYTNISFTSGSSEFLYSLQGYLHDKCSIHSIVNKDNRKDVFYLLIRTKNGVHKMYSYMYNEAGIWCLQRKKNKFTCKDICQTGTETTVRNP